MTSETSPSPPLSLRLLRSVLRLYPCMRGRGKAAFWGPVRRRCARLDRYCRARLASGETIEVVSDDYIGRMILLFGDLDIAITRFLRRVLRPGHLVIDVGANVGVVALRACRAVGPGGQVLAIEPQAALAERLSSSARHNGFQNLRVLAVAVGEREGRLQLAVPRGNLGLARLAAPGENDDAVEVRVARLDDLLAEAGIARAPRLLKLDVEGLELEVLRGAAGLFAATPPDLVLFEVNSHLGMEIGRIPTVAWLVERGYAIHRLSERGSLGPCDLTAALASRQNDLVASRVAVA